VRSFDIELLAQLSSTPGLPGRETRVAELIHANIGSPWQVRTDNIGNLIAHIPGEGETILLLAHMDEVGLIVRRVTKDGFLKVERLGGTSLRSLPGSRLELWAETGSIPAHAGVMPQHLDDLNPLDLEDVYIDIGAKSRAEVEDRGVRIGDGLTWSNPILCYEDDYIVGKALDDRLGCWILLTLAKYLQFDQLSCDLHLGFVVQEETNLMGGTPLVHAINPDVVIGIDGTLAFDTPDLEGKQSDIRLGEGPTIKIMDAIRARGVTYVPNLDLLQRIRTYADDNRIKLQSEIITITTVQLRRPILQMLDSCINCLRCSFLDSILHIFQYTILDRIVELVDIADLFM
jgi:endoglucanase